MTRAAALHRLGLYWHDLPQLRLDLLSAIARANTDLLDSFTKGASHGRNR